MENQNEVQDLSQANMVSGDQPVAQALGGAPTPSALQPQIKYAGFWIRFAATFIDGLVLFIPQAIIGGLMTAADFGVMQELATRVASLLVTWVYYVFMTNTYQATLGKKAVGIKVFSTRPENLTLNQVLLRETVGKLISMLILFVGYIIAGFTKKKQALHDMIAGTVVIYDDPNKKTPIWVYLIAALLPMIIIGGILSSIVLVSLGSARNKAQDAGIKSAISSLNVAALLHKDENASYKGFIPGSNASVIACSGQPVINISSDGEQLAIFMKSCKDEEKYFCGNPETGLVTQTAEALESYVKSGATICNPSDIMTTSLP